MKQFTLLLFLGVVIIFASCQGDETGEPVGTLDQQLTQLIDLASQGGGKAFFTLPESGEFSKIPQDPRNQLSAEKVELGKLLFHETGLAKAPKLAKGLNTYSCASCHHAGGGFQACKVQGVSEGGMGYGFRGEGRIIDPDYPLDSLDVQPIRSPSAMNGAYQQVMLWNGQFGATGPNAGTEANWTAGTPKETNHLGYEGLETQAIAALTVHRLEVDMDLIQNTEYKQMFDAAFPDFPVDKRYTKETAGLAIGAFERTLLANRSAFQQWLRGDNSAMTDGEKRGAMVFFGKGQCTDCHTGPALNSMTFYALGMDDFDPSEVFGVSNQAIADAGKGRASFTGKPEDMYKFKTPQLYNLGDSPFYGHGGTFRTIKEVIEYKNAAVPENPAVPESQLAEDFEPLNLSPQEIDYLVAFLRTGLLDRDLYRYEPVELPSGFCFPNNDPRSRKDLGCE